MSTELYFWKVRFIRNFFVKRQKKFCCSKKEILWRQKWICGLTKKFCKIIFVKQWKRFFSFCKAPFPKLRIIRPLSKVSWGMVTWCNLSRQKFNTTKWVWFQIPSQTSSSEYRGNKKIWKKKLPRVLKSCKGFLKVGWGCSFSKRGVIVRQDTGRRLGLWVKIII